MDCRKAPRGSQALFISRDRACEWIVERHLEDHKLYLSLGIEHVSGLVEGHLEDRKLYLSLGIEHVSGL